MTSTLTGLPAAKAAFAGKCRGVCAVSFVQARLNLSKPHFPAACRTGRARHGGMRRLRRDEDAKPSLDFLIENGDAVTQILTSRPHDPTALHVEGFPFFD